MRRLLVAVALVLAAGLGLGGSRPAVTHAQPQAPRWGTYARITGYTCPPFCGPQAVMGGAACSRDIPFGSTVWVAGDPYTCDDYGDLDCDKYHMGCESWIDIYAGSYCVVGDCWVTRLYGDYQWVDVE